MKTLYLSIKLLYTRINQDRLFREASALTYQSFLALVPMLAVLFGIAKGFNLDQVLENWIRVELKDHQEILSYFLQFSQTTLQEASGGIIAGIGTFFLLFTAVRLLSAVETTFTSMWGFHHGRSFVRKVSDYLALLLVCPVLLAVSGSATIFATTQLTTLTGSFATAKPLVTSLIGLFPFLTSAVLFSLILFAMPCAPVRFRSALIAGAIASIMYQFIQAWYIIFQLRLTKVSAVYGSFVALPLFLVWLWISWLLVLIAGELCVFIQEKGWKASCLHFRDTALEKFELDISILTLCLSHFSAEKVLTTKEVFESISLPIKAVAHSLERLHEEGLIHVGTGQNFSSTLIPRKKTSSLTLADLVLPEGNRNAQTPLTKQLENTLTNWKANLKKDPANIKLLDLPSHY